MKKRVLLMLICFALLCLSACGKAATQATTEPSVPAVTEADATAAPSGIGSARIRLTTESETQTEPETFVAATVSVRFADDSLPPEGQYESFDAGTESPQTKIVLSTNATVRDFKVLSLTDGDIDESGDMHFTIKELYTLDRLTADRPLVVATTFYGLIPNNGISYMDETGATRYFAVDMSGEDGSLYLWEFTA